VVAPLLSGERLMGLLLVLSPRVAGFGPEHEALLRHFAPGAAAALALAEEAHLRRQRERELEALRETLRERQAELDAVEQRLLELLGNELREPLSPIVVAASLLLRRGTLGEADTRAAARIARSAERMGRMIGQVLDFTRTRLGAGLVLLRSRVDLDAMAQDAVAEAELAHPDRLVRYARRGEALGRWDRERLRELLTQLLDNALRHGDPKRPVDVQVRDEGEQVVLEVRNQGAPIPAEALPALFDPFRQERLGLYIAREIALAHGGSLDVRSTAREGTSFQVRLPRGHADERAPESPPPPARPTSSG
jgi:signal transduction histidine kinase